MEVVKETTQYLQANTCLTANYPNQSSSEVLRLCGTSPPDPLGFIAF